MLKLRQIEVQTGQGGSLTLACKEAEICELCPVVVQQSQPD